MSVGITYVLVGNKDLQHLENSVSILKSYVPNIDVKIYHDYDFNSGALNSLNVRFRKYKRERYSTREENRNSSLWRLISLQESEHDVTLYLDNDIYIVHPGFFKGFEIAKNFGTCMVQNPRMFIKTLERDMGDLDRGADVLPYDHNFLKNMPEYMTSYNMGVTFSTKDDIAFIEELIKEQKENPSRGQAGLYRTIWKTKKAPYCLPINWLVCKKHCGIERPLSLHVGHPNVYDWWKKEFKR